VVYLIRAFILVGLISSFSGTSLAADLPKRIQAEYSVTKDGMAFADVRETFVVTGSTYKIESETKGIGVYALLGVRKLVSTGKVTRTGLKPSHFELHQGKNPKKALFADFDWPKNTLRMQVKGEPREATLTAGTQDLASFAYQFMYLPKPLAKDVIVKLTTGKKLNTYEYSNNEMPSTLNVAGKSYKAIHLAPKNNEKGQVETKELWLAADRHYLLLRFLMVDEHGAKLEQTLTKLHVE
jgi:hypothetical protein